MKPSPILLIGLLCLCASTHAQSPTNSEVAPATNAPTLETLVQEYQPLAASLIDKQAWNGQSITATDLDRSQIRELKSLNDQMLNTPNSYTVIFNLLKSYQNHDGYSRQALFWSIIGYSKQINQSNKETVFPFLKQVFLESLNFNTANYPNRIQGWLSPGTFRSQLGRIISNKVNYPGPPTLLSMDSHQLLNTNPILWINQKIP